MLTIYNADALKTLSQMESASVQCVVTSPPYWRLRDYKTEGQIGLEDTPEECVQKMVIIFREVRRVLKDDGTIWVNLGDSHFGGNRGNQGKNADVVVPRMSIHNGVKPKDLVGFPWMVAFALRADGWYLRSDIIWSKPNPMPESVRDRPTKAHEYLFLLSKSRKYYYDADAIRTNMKGSTLARLDQNIANQNGSTRAYGGTRPDRPMKSVFSNANKERGHERPHNGFKNDWDAMPKEEQQKNGANKRTVWEIATYPFSDAHFATFPPALVEPCILAGSAPGDIILDPFFGSGTTGSVANKHGRQAIGIELNTDYCELSLKRFDQKYLNLY